MLYMENDQQFKTYIINLLERLDEGDFSARGKIFENNENYNDIILAINKLAEKLNNLYESGREFENRINEIIDIIVAYASLNFSKKINTVSRTNILYPVTTGLQILGKELSELTVEKNYFETLLKVLPDMLVILDQKGIIETVNETALITLGYIKEELTGNPIKKIFKDDFILFQGPTRERIINHGLISNLDKFFITKDNRKIPVSLSASVVLNRKKEIRGYICVAHDMTEYKRNEKILNLRMKELAEARSAALNMMEDAYEANKSKTIFLTNMSHELRTPMSAIIGISQILIQSRSENLTAEQKEGIDIINQSGKRLLSLINDILDLSKIDVGKMEIEYSKFQLQGVIANLEKITKNLIAEKDIKLVIQVDSMLPDAIISDEKKLNQILLNIMGNAVKFTDQGRIIMRVFLREDRIYFEVEDTGIGIKKDQIQFIFEEFKQLDGSKSRKYPGTGLGLSLSKKMVQLLNGKINVESELNKGTKIQFFIPFIQNENMITSSPAAGIKDEDRLKENQERDIRQKPLILITDDEDICQFTVKMMLKQHYELVFAKTGIEAVDKYFKTRPQLVLMDIMMPEMDGYRAFKHIREKDTEKKVPIIAVTARAMEEDKEKIIQFGFDDYISKPFDVRQLDKKIRQFLDLMI